MFVLPVLKDVHQEKAGHFQEFRTAAITDWSVGAMVRRFGKAL
jgi:hypothetical protein